MRRHLISLPPLGRNLVFPSIRILSDQSSDMQNSGDDQNVPDGLDLRPKPWL